jgi:hypothetical protein
MRDHSRVPNFDTPLSPASQAQRVLFALGFQIAGRRATAFAVRLRTPTEGGSGTSTDARIRRAMAAIEDGPVAFVAENPELRDEPLSEPARTVAEAAEAVVYALGQRLIDAPEPPPLTLRRDCQ